MTYDPVKAHAYYEKTKELKGRQKGPGKSLASKTAQRPPAKKSNSDQLAAKKARVDRLRESVAKLQKALQEAQSALRAKQGKSRQTQKKEAKKDSDGKSTAKEKQASKEYRDKHKEKIASSRKKDGKSGGGGSTSSNSVSDMGVDELKSRIKAIQGALSDAKRQLSNAQRDLGQLAHSAITTDPEFNAHFAQFIRAEGTSI